MRKGMLTVVSMVAVVAVAGSVYAGCGSCPGDKPKAKAKAAPASSCDCYSAAQMEDLGLSSTQKKRITAAKTACKKKIDSILTSEQKKKLAPAKCAAPARKGCK